MFPFPAWSPAPASPEAIKQLQAAARTVGDLQAPAEERVKSAVVLKDAGALGAHVHSNRRRSRPRRERRPAASLPLLPVRRCDCDRRSCYARSGAATDRSPEDLLRSGAVEALVRALTTEWPAGGDLASSRSANDAVAHIAHEYLR